jgi:hypothetical protein
VCSDRARQPLVGRQQLSTQELSERDVTGVICAEVRVQTEDAWQQALVAMPRERQKLVVGQGLVGTLDRQAIVEQRPTEAGRHLDVAERGHPKIGIGLP